MKRILLLVTIAGGLASQRVLADETSDAIEALKKQIQELDQKVRVLEREKELDTEAVAAKAKDVPRIVVGANGLTVSSADTNFAFAIHGVLQVDNHSYFNDGGIPSNEGFVLRRARPIISGTVFRDFDFMFVPDFGGSSVQIVDAYLNYRYRPWLQVRAGKYKPPIGLEALQSDSVTLFSEKGYPTELTPNRDLGFQLWGEAWDGTLGYGAGVFNGVGDARQPGNSDFEDHREFAARLFVQPFKKSETRALKGIGFGVGGSWGNVSSNSAGLPSTTGGTLPGYFTADGMQQFFAYTNTTVANGDHWRIAPQAYYYYGPFNLLGEYTISEQRISSSIAPFAATTVRNTAWQVAAGWVLTGEDASYTGIIPKHPFDPRAGCWGALQLVGRYGELDVDDDAFPLFSNPAVSASAVQSWGVGLNWYLNRNIRFNASYSRATFTGGSGPGSTATTAPGMVTRQPEEQVTTRVQLAF